MYALETAQATRLLHEGFFVGKQLLCSREVYWVRTNLDADAYMPSKALFCQKCGEVWGRRVYFEQPADWRVDCRPCQRHGGGELIDWTSIEADQALNPYYDDHFPKELLDYELSIALASA